MMTKPKVGLIFDLDDTIYLEQEYVRSGFAAVSRYLTSDVNQADSYAQKLHSYTLEIGDGRAFDHLLDEFPQAKPGTIVETLVDIYRSHVPQLELHPVWKEQLLAWRDQEVFLGLISDGVLVGQQNKVNALGLSQLFDEIILTDQFGRDFWKPHARSYEAMQNASGLSGDALAYIGDNVSKDFIAPNALGWHTVRLRLTGQVREHLEAKTVESSPKVEVRGIEELLSHLNKWLVR